MSASDSKPPARSPVKISRHSPTSPLSPGEDLRAQTAAMVATLHQQQAQLTTVNRQNRDMEQRLLALESELRMLKKDQAEADQLISNLVDIFACMKPKEDTSKCLEQDHPALYLRLRGFRDRLENFLELKRE